MRESSLNQEMAGRGIPLARHVNDTVLPFPVVWVWSKASLIIGGTGYEEKQALVNLYQWRYFLQANHILKHTHTHAHTHARTRTHTHTHTHAYANTHTHTRTHTRTHTHTHSHTLHIHSEPYACSITSCCHMTSILSSILWFNAAD